ncbi:MAG: DUF4389 domain-containing protein [Candidatus Woesearchaeota archaeon]|jgi:hypothetical protein|nr:DUF4389 domain-containing protein [Candidatus Woesearchaeota archaeon]MDP7181336.1 DUF4389 domain-containing protein [Candidatus Woesearchaeota archaeon]MDP7198045.1 DUF4389 domain-containing protein [Candidatus Woesearchaeota archaeon]MDP7466879.1 DUF4389 domain-containing protein [Candidatus Woesearchaeota archaeon]MDP7647315.1 DUF4389 domain-containing protein [Candidatus Woesearchaeota archaeon]
MKKERKEALIRIPICIVSGLILGVWWTLVKVLIILQWLIVIFSSKRNRGLAKFCQIFNTQAYNFIRYMTFHTNARPFPFSDLAKDFDKYER